MNPPAKRTSALNVVAGWPPPVLVILIVVLSGPVPPMSRVPVIATVFPTVMLAGAAVSVTEVGVVAGSG